MLQTILQDMQEPCLYLKDAMVISLGTTTLITIVRFRILLRLEWSFSLKCFVSIAYFLTLLQVTLLSRKPGSRTTTNFMPFSTFGTTIQSRAYEIENILLFLPMGILLPIIFKPAQRFKQAVKIIILISLGIEIVQRITGRGYMQTDDVIMNVLGGSIGFVIAFLFFRGSRE